jgi:ectoine hydrolase
MTTKRLPFDQAEYDRRLLMTRMAMALAGLDALLVSDPSNMAWLTGYEAWTFNVPQGVIVLQDADPIWWGRDGDTMVAQRTIWMPDACVIGYVDDYVQSSQMHPMEDLARHLDGMGVQNLGIEMDSYYFSAKAFSVLLQTLPNIGFADATGMVNLQRLIKSEPEIAFMRKAAAISKRIGDGVIDRIAIGVPKNTIVSELYRDALLGVEGASGDYPAVAPTLTTGGGVSNWDEQPFAADDMAAFNVSGCYRRYHAPISRTVFLGTPTDKMRKAEAAVLEGLEAGIEAAKAGSRACDIAVALTGSLEGAGFEQTARCGYPVGVGFPPDLGERAITLRVTDESILEPNMTFNLGAQVNADGWGMAIAQSIRIRTDGAAEVLGDRPKGITAKG